MEQKDEIDDSRHFVEDIKVQGRREEKVFF